MRKTGKSKIVSVLLVGIMCLGIVTTAFGSTNTSNYSYSVDTNYAKVFTYTPLYSGQAMALNTRPSGPAGVNVWAHAYDGDLTFYFPNQVSVPEATFGMESRVAYTIKIKSRSGNASGVLTRTISD